MKKLLFTGLSVVVGLILVFAIVGEVVAFAIPPYPDKLGDVNYTEKITGRYLVEQSAARENNVILYGSSELRTYDILTHPANFFQGQRNGIQVNLVGRGSCQSLIHAISIAATGDALTGKKVVLITSPQSYVEGGIAPDLFMANFSEQQYTTLMLDPEIPYEYKRYISQRVNELTKEYNNITGASMNQYNASGILSRDAAKSDILTAAKDLFLKPYYYASKWLLDLKDQVASGKLIREVGQEPVKAAASGEIDWDAELVLAVGEAEKLTDNNDFGILNDYYTTYIGRKLDQQKNKDKNLSYSVSKEYQDLELLLELCRLKGIEPLFVHVPLHGTWSDHTGFSKERREEYYQNVRDIVGRYDNVELLDLTAYEYEEYFLCDIMHLGWKGWLAVDQAIDRYYHEN